MTDNSMTPRAPMHSVLTYAPGAKPKHGDVVVARLKGQTAPFIGYLKIQNRKFVIAPTNPEFKPFSADESRFEAVDPVVGWFTLLTQEGQEKMARRVAEIRLEIASVERGEI
ncbi:MAG: hypothetical protein JWN25_2981 [Verrucomicrobiales bacterium]|nr:hypothetical protein [Verrucomicrobiales bacterium]